MGCDQLKFSSRQENGTRDATMRDFPGAGKIRRAGIATAETEQTPPTPLQRKCAFRKRVDSELSAYREGVYPYFSRGVNCPCFDCIIYLVESDQDSTQVPGGGFSVLPQWRGLLSSGFSLWAGQRRRK